MDMSERKYSQKGYQNRDQDREQPRSRPKGPRDPTDRPRGRGLGNPTAVVFRCAVCGAKNETGKELDAAAGCVKCSTDLDTCTHCAFFDSGAPSECRKPVKVYVASKAKRNACELFEPKAAKEFAAEPAPSKDAHTPKTAKDAFDDLFNF